MYFYPILYTYSMQTSPMGNNMQMVQNYPTYFQNPDFCYNQTYIMPVQELLPQQNITILSEKSESTLNQPNSTSRDAGRSQMKNKKYNSHQPLSQTYLTTPLIYTDKNTPHYSSDKTYFNQPHFAHNRCRVKFEEEQAHDIQADQPNEVYIDQQNNYPKKNTESNVVNQIFSFISTESKSLQIVQKFLKKDKKKITSFYQILKAIKKRKKKYINRKYLCTLCTIKQKDIGYKMLLRARNKMNVLTVPEFQKILCTLIIYYLRDESEINIITSKKINKFTFMEHLERRREIKMYLLKKFGESARGEVGDRSEGEEESDGLGSEI